MNPIGVLREKQFYGTTVYLFPDPSQTQHPFSSSTSGEAATDSIGVFRRGEIDGKPNFIFVYLSETESPSSSSFPQALFICPSLRLKIQKLQENGPNRSYRFQTSPLFPGTGRSTDQQVQSMLDSDIQDGICMFPMVPFVKENEDDGESEYEDEDEDEDEDEYEDEDVDEEDEHDDDDDDDDDENEVEDEDEHVCEHDDEDDDDDVKFEYCTACRREIVEGTYYYMCDTCCYKFHKECVESPLEIQHPSHPFLSFQLYNVRPDGLDCIVCETSLNHQQMIYYSATSNLGMHMVCAMKPVPIVITNPKRHPHPLTFFPKQDFLPCNVCGLTDESFPVYVCLPCVFVVHRDCIYLPYVIRISRHHHRISFTSSLPPRKLLCGVCRQEVDNHYGAYECKNCDDYFVHSLCAVRKDLWDGKELEGVPEEPEINIEPFERISDGVIRHFSHKHHHLKLEMFTVYDQDRFCQACVLPIYQGSYYSCSRDECDFILHEACASLPRKKYHAFHPHQLTLVTSNINDKYEFELKGCFICHACERTSCGFVYECLEEEGCRYQLDVRCASVSEPFEYQGHEHPLFLALKPEEENSELCYICRRQNTPTMFFIRKMLNCIDCRNTIICLTCATLPYKARYKHDKHFLTFRGIEPGSKQSDWCDVCERKILHSERGGFYSCDDCCATLHVNCLLGKTPYMKPGHTIKYGRAKFQILPNNSQTRPFCHVHDKSRVEDRIVFKRKNKISCSYTC